MQAYRITEGQKNALIKPEKHNGMYFAPRQDINGNNFIWEVEAIFCRENFGFTLQPAEFIEPIDNTGIPQ